MHMKVIHITSKVLLKVVEIAIIAVVIASVIPLVAGGLTIDNEPQASMEVNDDGYTVTISGSVDVSSSLMWDISDLSYYVTVGDENAPVARSAPVLTSIPKGGSTPLTFSIEVPIINLALYMLDSGMGDSGSMSTMKVPVQFGIGGHYIQNLIGFDLDVGLDLTMETDTVINKTVSASGDHVEMEVEYTAGTELPISDVAIEFEIRSDAGIVKGVVDIDDNGIANVLKIDLDGAGTNVRDIINGNDLKVFVKNEDGTWNEIPITFNSTMVIILNSILDKLGVPE